MGRRRASRRHVEAHGRARGAVRVPPWGASEGIRLGRISRGRALRQSHEQVEQDKVRRLQAKVTETTHVTARIPAPLGEALARLADRDDRTLSAEVRRAVREYVERNDKTPAAAGERPDAA